MQVIKEYEESIENGYTETLTHEEVKKNARCVNMKYQVLYTKKSNKAIIKIEVNQRNIILAWIEKKFGRSR